MMVAKEEFFNVLLIPDTPTQNLSFHVWRGYQIKISWQGKTCAEKQIEKYSGVYTENKFFCKLATFEAKVLLTRHRNYVYNRKVIDLSQICPIA